MQAKRLSHARPFPARLARLGLSLILLTSLLGAAHSPAHAATITVNTLADESDGSCSDGDCSLRDAIAVAATGDTINFSVTGTITLTLGRIMITGKNLTINGPGASNLTISGNNNSVLNLGFQLTTTVSGLTITKGGDSSNEYGIYDNGGTLTLTDCVFSGNRTGVSGGGTLHVTRCAFTNNLYGGIFFSGTASVADSFFSSNGSSGIYIGSMSSTVLNVTNSTFSHNSGSTGGGIYNHHGTLNVTGSTFSGNNAPGGGAIYNGGTMTVTSCAFSNNTAVAGSSIYSASSAVINNSTFSGNTASDRGAINNVGTLTVTGSAFSGNSAPWGNIHNDGTATVISSTFIGNSATGGGGILNDSGTLTVIDSTFSGNVGPAAESYGGGIDNTSTATVINSTFTGNSAHAGGGIGNWGTLTVLNSTLSGNDAAEGGGIYISASRGTATLTNTIVANSPTGGNCHGAATTASANNLTTDVTCTIGFIQVTPAQLALDALTGAPAYFPLKRGSAAIDAGTNTSCPAADQRGVARPQDGNGDSVAVCDIGSYEYKPFVPTAFLYLPLIRR
jgi:CSLREA domain-containing protein